MRRNTLFAIFLFFFPLSVFAAGVVINEIAWMGMLPKTGESVSAASNNEWVELYNSSNVSVTLDGWKFISEDGMPNITIAGMIAAGGYFLLERGTTTVAMADFIYPYKDNALSNSGEHLFLKDGSGLVVDEVNATTIWPAGDNTTKATMQRLGDTWITATATPRAVNIGTFIATSSQGVTLTPAPLPAPSPILPSTSFTPNPLEPPPVPTIKAYAGKDRIIAAGSEEEFLGYAFGYKDEPLENARFWWNFGDGESKDGRAVSHIFQAPGKYTIGVHVSSGSDAASDFLTAEVMPNQVAIEGVLGGDTGYIRLVNPANTVIDIGGWTLENFRGKKFVITPKTKIGAKSEIALMNNLTGLWQSDGFYPLTVRYPNASIAFQYNALHSSAIVSIPSGASSSLIQKVSRENAVIISRTQVNTFHSASTSIDKKINNSPQSSVEEKHDPTQSMAGVATHTSISSSLFFLIAFGISFFAAIGFIFIKSFF